MATLTGTGFGDSLGTGTVTFFLADASEYPVWNDTTIKAVIPLAAESGVVYVTASGNKSNQVDFLVIQHVTSITPAKAKVGDEVMIQGLDFPAEEGHVAFNGSDAFGISAWTETLISVEVPEGARNGKVSVVAKDTLVSNGVDFTVIPDIVEIIPSSAKTGEEITIKGQGFGDTLSTNRVTFHTTSVSKFTKWTNEEIVLNVPWDAESGKVRVKAGSETSSGVDFDVIPHISRVNPTTAKVGDKVTLSGSGFGSNQGSSVVSFNGADAGVYIYWTTKTIELLVPSGAQSGKVFVTVDGNKSNEVDITIFGAPQITEIDPDSAGVDDQIAISGKNFGTSRGESKVTFERNSEIVEATNYVSWSSTKIRIKVPDGATSCKVYVTVNAARSNGVEFKVGCPPPEFDVVTIGDQTWMAENLDVERYRNGDPIPQVTDAAEWANLTTGAWCYYDNETSNGRVYGKMYNYYAVTDPRGLAPRGWHVSTVDDWDELANYLGGYDVAGGKLKETGTTHWNDPNTDATNESGFTGLPGGYRMYDGSFNNLGTQALFWTTTSKTARSLHHNATGLRKWDGSRYDKGGFSVRCVKD